MADSLPIDHNIDDILAAISATPDATSGDPVADALTWEQLGPDLNHPAANVPMPGEVSTPQPDLTGYKGPKVSGSFRGITPEGTKNAKGFYGEADKRIADQTGEAASVYQAQADQSRDHYTAVGDALDVAIQKTAEFQRRDEELNNQLIDFNRTWADVEARSAAMAQAERQQYIADYKQQLAVVRQLAMQSGNPMGQLSRGEAIGLAGAQFAQGFLAAQGINIDVAGQVDRWVERSIQEHQFKIQNARASAEDQLHLYELSRQNSQDEWEARQRYRGFVIAGLQSAIHLNASRFQSDIAMARAQEQIARLQVEADSTERAIADKFYDRVHQIMSTENQRAYQMGSLAIEQRKAALEAAKAAWDMDPRNPKNKGKPEDVPLNFRFADPEYATDDSGEPVLINGQKVRINRWQVDPRIAASDPVLARSLAEKGDEARKQYANYLDATNDLMNTWNKAKDKYRQYLALPESVRARMEGDGDIQAYKQARDRWVLAKVYNDSGKAVTEQEFKRHSDQAYRDLYLAENGDKAEKSYAQLRTNGRRAFERHFESSGYVKVDENDPERYAPFEGASPVGNARDHASLHGEKAPSGMVELQLRGALQKDSDDEQRPYTAVSGAWADFKQIDYSGLKKASGAAKDYAAREFSQSEGAVAVEMLAAIYARPNLFAKKGDYGGLKKDADERPSDLRKAAYDALSKLSVGEAPDGRRVSPELMEWAGYLRSQISSDEQLSNAMEHDKDVLDSPFAKRLADRPGKN